MIKPLVLFFVELSVLRRPVSDVPYSRALLAVLLVLGVLAEVGSSQFPPLTTADPELMAMRAELWRATGLSVVFSLLMAGGLWSLLTVFGHPERLLQSFTAVTGASFVHTLAFIAAQLVCALLSLSGTAVSNVLELCLIFWGFAIMSHVFRDAFELGRLAGTVAAVSFLISLQILAVALFPNLFPYVGP